MRYRLLEITHQKDKYLTYLSKKLVMKRINEESGLSIEYEYSFSLEDSDTFCTDQKLRNEFVPLMRRTTLCPFLS